MQKAQTVARDARSYAKRQAAAAEQYKAQLTKKLEDMRDRCALQPRHKQCTPTHASMY